MRAALALVVLLAGCPTSAPPTGGASTATTPAASASTGTPTATASASASPSVEPSASPSASASASTSATQDDGPPWVRGLSSGCTVDDDCIKVRACVSYAIRRDAEATFKERIEGVRFRCERQQGAGSKPPSRAACVDGTCELVTP